MNYKMITFQQVTHDKKDELSALLSTLVLTGLEETDDTIIGYAEENEYDEAAIKEIAVSMGLSFTTEIVEERNWNSEWEQNFEPVIIDGFCSVRADFHPEPANVEHDIIITPKMSFGTGHHATTASMITLMRDLDFKNKSVFDFGTGTGILAILAEQLGASSILAIDNDEWSYTNAVENCERNNATKVTVQQATADDLNNDQYDIILANINRHILLAYMEQMYTLTKAGGTLLLSGILTEDIPMIRKSAEQSGYQYNLDRTEGNWVCMQFSKQ